MNKSIKSALLLCSGPVLMVLSFFIAPPEGLSNAAWHTAAMTIWLAIWWISEIVPIPATSLVPLVVVPIAGIAPIKSVSASYSHPLIFLFLGGFMLSIAMERWGLHKRIALKTLLMSGNKPSTQIMAMMGVTAFLSMWMSNTATAVMMLPIALSVVHVLQQPEQENDTGFAKALLLAIAYGASIGGVATLIGTPPNALMAAYLMESYDIHIGFGQWMILGVPLSVLLLIATWFWLTKVIYKVDKAQTQLDTKDVFRGQLRSLGATSQAEKGVLLVFITAAACWMFRPLLADATGLAISDTGIAIAAALLLFILPAGKGQRILDWESAVKLPWGVLLLFGGGLALAAQIKGSGLADYIAELLSGAQHLELALGVIIVVALITFLTEVTSNTATAAGFLPLLGPVAESISGTPLVWVVPAAIAASCAFMMPVATPPNAIVFGSGKLEIKDMIRAGFALNIMAIVLITMMVMWLGPMVFGY